MNPRYHKIKQKNKVFFGRLSRQPRHLFSKEVNKYNIPKIKG